MPAARRPRKQDLRLFLLREGVDVDQALERPDDEEVELASTLPFDARLFTRSARSRVPAWIDFVQSGTGATLDYLTKFNLSAVLFIMKGSRLLAYTWGPAGRYMVRSDVKESGFGLRAVLNAVDPDKLRSLDIETFEDQTLRSRIQASQQSPIDVFGIDPARDILNAVAGTPRDQSFATFMSGTDALRFSAHVRFEELADICERSLTLYDDTLYRENFPWVDNIRAVRDPGAIVGLNEALVSAIRDGDVENTYLAPPEILDWDDFNGFTYPASPEEPTMELDIEAYLISKQDMSALTLDDLQADRVRAHASDDRYTEWSIFDCRTSSTRPIQFCLSCRVADGSTWRPTTSPASTRMSSLSPSQASTYRLRGSERRRPTTAGGWLTPLPTVVLF